MINDTKYHLNCIASIAKEAGDRIISAKERIHSASDTKPKDRKTQLQNQIHAALLELCAIADESDQVLEVDIRTVYLNSAGKVQCNAVLECNVTIIDKGEL